MKSDLQPYWSLYLDFLDAFQSLTYGGIPLPLCIDFRRYITREWKDMLKRPEISHLLKHKVTLMNDIQPNIDRYLQPFKSPVIMQKNDGKILFCTRNLSFSPEAYSTLIDHSPYVSVESSGWDLLSNHVKDALENSVKGHTSNLIFQTNQLLMNLDPNHPLFQNPSLINQFIREIPHLLKELMAAEQIIAAQNIAYVLTGTTTRRTPRIFTLMAIKKGIPSICLQHSILFSEGYYLPVLATKQAVYGQWDKEWYMRRGVKQEQIEILGHPRFDGIFTEVRMSEESFRTLMGLNPLKKTILIATQNNPSKWEFFLQLLAKYPQFQVIIKPHPHEIRTNELQTYEKLCSKYKSLKLVSSNIKLYDLIAHADITVANQSTVGLEAMLLGKPVFIWDRKKDAYYGKALGELYQTNPSKLIRIILHWFENGKFRDYAEQLRKNFLSAAYPYPLSGKRLRDLIFRSAR